MGTGGAAGLFFSSVCMALGWKHTSRKNQIKLSAGEDFSLHRNPDVGNEIFCLDFSLHDPLKLDGSTMTEE